MAYEFLSSLHIVVHTYIVYMYATTAVRYWVIIITTAEKILHVFDAAMLVRALYCVHVGTRTRVSTILCQKIWQHSEDDGDETVRHTHTDTRTHTHTERVPAARLSRDRRDSYLSVSASLLCVRAETWPHTHWRMFFNCMSNKTSVL